MPNMKNSHQSKFFFLLFFVPALLLTGYLTDTKPTSNSESIIKNISLVEANKLIQNNLENKDFIIVDVRTKKEFQNGYIENAMNIDYHADNFSDLIEKLERNKTYLIYCRSGGRSGSALRIMDKMGFEEVYNMTGGITQWQEEGFPITSE